MDGIDLDIEGGDYKYYPEFITELRTLMDNDQSKGYLITGAPQCPYPDHHMGPEKPGSGKEHCTRETVNVEKTKLRTVFNLQSTLQFLFNTYDLEAHSQNLYPLIKTSQHFFQLKVL